MKTTCSKPSLVLVLMNRMTVTKSGCMVLNKILNFLKSFFFTQINLCLKSIELQNYENDKREKCLQFCFYTRFSLCKQTIVWIPERGSTQEWGWGCEEVTRRFIPKNGLEFHYPKNGEAEKSSAQDWEDLMDFHNKYCQDIARSEVKC